jgi:hypothetical protein
MAHGCVPGEELDDSGRRGSDDEARLLCWVPEEERLSRRCFVHGVRNWVVLENAFLQG